MRLRTEGVAARAMDGKVVVLDLTTSQYFTLGGSAVYLHEVLSKRELSIEDAVALLTDAFDVTSDQARADVQRFAAELEAAGLLIS